MPSPGCRQHLAWSSTFGGSVYDNERQIDHGPRARAIVRPLPASRPRIACEQPTGRLDRNDKKSLTRRQRLRRSMTQGRLHETSVSVVGQKGHNVRWPRRALLINRKRIKR